MADQVDVVERMIQNYLGRQSISGECGTGLTVEFGRDLDLGRFAERVGHLAEGARRRRKGLADRGAGHERIGIDHAAAGVELEPIMALRLGQELRIVGRIGQLSARGNVADRLIAAREHRQDQSLGLRLRERAASVLGGDAGGPHQGHAQAGHVEGVASVGPERTACPADAAQVRVVADLVVQKIEDPLRIVIQRRRFFLDVRIGRVGVGGGRQQARVRHIARLQSCRGGGIRHQPGVEDTQRLRAAVEIRRDSRGQRDGERHAGRAVRGDRAQAPGEVLPVLVGRLRSILHRHARSQRVAQQDAAERIGRFVIDRVGDRFLLVLDAAGKILGERSADHDARLCGREHEAGFQQLGAQMRMLGSTDAPCG